MKIKSTIQQMARQLTELAAQGHGGEEVVVEYGCPTTEQQPLKIGNIKWGRETMYGDPAPFNVAHLCDGSRLTVQHRLTGFGHAVFDTETGYRDPSGKFWLASGGLDVRQYPDFTVEQAIEWVKTNANTCCGE